MDIEYLIKLAERALEADAVDTDEFDDMELSLSIDELNDRYIEPLRTAITEEIIEAQIESWESVLH